MRAFIPLLKWQERLDKAQKKSIDNNLFPTYPSVQHPILSGIVHRRSCLKITCPASLLISTTEPSKAACQPNARQEK